MNTTWTLAEVFRGSSQQKHFPDDFALITETQTTTCRLKDTTTSHSASKLICMEFSWKTSWNFAVGGAQQQPKEKRSVECPKGIKRSVRRSNAWNLRWIISSKSDLIPASFFHKIFDSNWSGFFDDVSRAFLIVFWASRERQLTHRPLNKWMTRGNTRTEIHDLRKALAMFEASYWFMW
jgi:hypothetical protein